MNLTFILIYLKELSGSLTAGLDHCLPFENNCCKQVGWTLKDGAFQLVPVCKWPDTPCLRRHICEIQVSVKFDWKRMQKQHNSLCLLQVLLREILDAKKEMHKEYVRYRNLLCQ